MRVTITPTRLRGTVTPPPSKSQSHRFLLAAALAEGESVIQNVTLCDDVAATLRCVTALGASVTAEGSTLTVRGIGNRRIPWAPCMCGMTHLPCGQSASTLRFLMPVALALVGGAFFTGEGRLLARPMEPYAELFAQKGLFYAREARSITVEGRLEGGDFALPGNVSSQFVSGLLFALPLLEGDSTLRLTTPPESADYIAMTLDTLKRFGITVEYKNFSRFHIPGGQTYRPRTLSVEADWSQAAFWYAAAGLGSEITVGGMDPRSIQGDRVFPHWEELMGGEEPHAASIDVSHSPDLVPPAAARGACMNGTLYLNRAGRLRLKESDRLSAITEVLTAMGANVTGEADRLIIEGTPTLSGGCTVDCRGDHRIAMMAAVAAIRCAAPVTVTGAECVSKSYPRFWEDYVLLGGNIETSEV